MRLFVPLALANHAEIELPAAASRHAQVRRVQPGNAILLFDGSGFEWPAEVLAVTRSAVRVRLGSGAGVATEMLAEVTLAVGMPANERMDALVEKATELGVARLQPLVTERSVLRLAGERAERRREHWQTVAQAACEQCGRARVPVVEPVRGLEGWWGAVPAGTRWLLSPRGGMRPRPGPGSIVALSGPEGGLSDDEEAAARSHGFEPITLGPRVLRADTAPLALLAWLSLA